MSKKTRSRKNAWWLVRWIPANILAFAAILKVTSTPELLESNGLLSSPLLLFATIFFEFACSALIVLLSITVSWRLTFSVFSLLIVVGTYAHAMGESCNCFGNALPAWVSIASDIGVLALCLAALPPTPKKRGEGPRTSVTKAVFIAVGIGFLGVCTAGYFNVSKNRSDPLEFLLADELIGKPWPLASTLDNELAPLDSNRWLVLVVRRDCAHCQELLKRYFPDATTHRSGERTVIFVAGDRKWPFTFDMISMETDPTGSISWNSGEPFVASPAIFLVSNGSVIDAADGEQSNSFIAQLLDESTVDRRSRH